MSVSQERLQESMAYAAVIHMYMHPEKPLQKDRPVSNVKHPSSEDFSGQPHLTPA